MVLHRLTERGYDGTIAPMLWRRWCPLHKSSLRRAASCSHNQPELSLGGNPGLFAIYSDDEVVDGGCSGNDGRFDPLQIGTSRVHALTNQTSGQALHSERKSYERRRQG